MVCLSSFFFFLFKTHTPLHIRDSLSTGLALFSRFCPSQSRREVKKSWGQKESWVGIFSSSDLQEVVHKKWSTGAGCVLENLGGWAFVNGRESPGS